MEHKARWWLPVLAVVALAIGCGGDDSEATGGSDATGGTRGPGSTGGVDGGGTGGEVGAGGMVGTGGVVGTGGSGGTGGSVGTGGSGPGGPRSVSWVEVERWSDQLEDVMFTDANTGTAVGNNGAILRTTDGGANWVLQDSRTQEDLYAVSFADANTGMVVGTRGAILRTTDGGATWVDAGFDSRWYTDVHVIDSNTGFVLGSGTWLLRTTDGGATWAEDRLVLCMACIGRVVSFANADIGVAVAGTQTGSTLHSTADGGETWFPVSLSASGHYYDVHLLDTDNWIVLVDWGGFPRTTDGGLTWTNYGLLDRATGLPIRISGAFVSMHFFGTNTGIAVSGGGKIATTANGGIGWYLEDGDLTQLESGCCPTIRAAAFPQPGIVIGVGGWRTAEEEVGVIYRATLDGG